MLRCRVSFDYYGTLLQIYCWVFFQRISKICQRLAKLWAKKSIVSHAVCCSTVQLSNLLRIWHMMDRTVALLCPWSTIKLVYLLLTISRLPNWCHQWLNVDHLWGCDVFSLLLQVHTVGLSMTFGVTTVNVFSSAPNDANVTGQILATVSNGCFAWQFA